MHPGIGHAPLWILAELEPYTAGHVVGQGLVFLGLLAGVLKCWSISRRPTTNAKCVLGLMFMLWAFLVSCSLAVLTQAVGFQPAGTLLRGVLG